MTRDIAVFTGENGETLSLDNPGTITVYRREQGQWSFNRAQEFILDKERGIGGIRRQLAELLDFLQECRIFAAFSVTGMPYFELEKAGCRVWEIAGKPKDFLDNVFIEEEKAREQNGNQGTEVKTPAPVQVAPGCYQISLTGIQAGGTGVTSKQALLPFLRQGVFYSLEVLCSHIPPWLEVELAAGNLEGITERINKDVVKVLIRSKLCAQ